MPETEEGEPRLFLVYVVREYSTQTILVRSKGFHGMSLKQIDNELTRMKAEVRERFDAEDALAINCCALPDLPALLATDTRFGANAVEKEYE